MSDNLYLTNEQIFNEKKKQRKVFAKMSFDSKVQTIIEMQHMNLAMKKASGRLHQAFRPWDMTEEELQAYLNK